MKKILIDNLSFQEYQVQIQFTNSVNFPFFHGQKLNQLFCSIFGKHPDGNDIVLFPVELGRINYKIGDYYNFGITLIGNDNLVLETIKNGLENEANRASEDEQFRGNFELISIDKIHKQKFKFIDSPKEQFTLQFLTPLRMQLTNPQKSKKFFTPFVFEPERFFELLLSRVLRLTNISNKEKNDLSILELPKIELIEKTLIWVDVPYSKTFGGVIGKVIFGGSLNKFWQNILWLGQFLHAGNLSAFGFGKYLITSLENNIITINSASTFQDSIIEPENMIDSFHHIKSSSKKETYSRKLITDFENKLFSNLDDIVKKVNNKKYKPVNLRGIILPKGNSKIRALAIPALKDKILQRALTQIISPSIDRLLEDSSFAYRKGFSRQSAARTITEAKKNGYKYVFKADINSFFDNVDWIILFNKIEAIFYNDPIVKLLKKWVTQSVEYKGKVIKRTKGLPQGLPISPVLANLFLDEFDEALLDDYKLIRYADDFLILCKSKEELEKAKAKTEQALKKLQLELKNSKTKSTSFNEGFQYLGYLFVKSLILEKSKKEQKEQLKQVAKTDLEIPEGSWLNSVDISKVQRIEKLEIVEKENVKPLHKSLRDEHKIPIYISDPKLSVFLNNQLLVIQNKTDSTFKEKRIQINKILFVVFIGRARITLPAVIRLRDSGVPSFFLHPNGKMHLSIITQEPNYTLWQKQAELLNNNKFIMSFAKAIVTTQINNYKVIARRKAASKNILLQFATLEKSVSLVENIDELRGFEGKSAAILYSVIKESIPNKWEFLHRTKHPPEGPINVMLSLGFTIVYNHITTALQIVGLNPEIGYYHKLKSNHYALASDIIEEFRHIIINHVNYIINRNIICYDDFYFNENGKYPCLIKNEPRKKFISSIEERLQTKISPNNDEDSVTYQHYFYLKAKMIKSLISNPEQVYEPLRIK